MDNSLSKNNNEDRDGLSTSKRIKLESTVNDPNDCSKGVSFSENILARELDQRIFTYVSDSNTFNFAKFGILKLGPLCNASESCLFTKAYCHVKTLRNENNLALILGLNQLFSRGVELLKDVKHNRKLKDLDQHELTAIKILDRFFQDKDQHEQSLNKILRGHQSENSKKGFSAVETTLALTEHLLAKLAPGKSYIVNRRLKEKGKCRCGYDFCDSNPVFGNTGIGHEEGWHGFADVMFASYCVEPDTAASFYSESLNSSMLTSPADDDDDDGEDPRGEAKLSLSATESKAVAQTIVFSFLQRKRHPNSSNFMIPNILISSHSFRIIMYDAVNDILLCSVPLPIFQPYPSKSLEIASIIILWMVLHYRIFCDGIDTSLIKEAGIDIKNIQADFKERAKEKMDFYVNAPKFGLQEFPFVPKETFPSFETLSLGVHAIPKKLVK